MACRATRIWGNVAGCVFAAILAAVPLTPAPWPRDGIGLLKSSLALWPKGKKRDEAEQKVKAAEEALSRADAELAQKLGYPLCRCDFPPKVMLWREKEHAFVCPDPKCGRQIGDSSEPLPTLQTDYF